MRAAVIGFVIGYLATISPAFRPAKADAMVLMGLGQAATATYVEAQMANSPEVFAAFERKDGLTFAVLYGKKSFWPQVCSGRYLPVQVIESSPYQGLLLNAVPMMGQGPFGAVRNKLFHYGLYKPPFFKRYYYDGDYFAYPVVVPPQDLRALALVSGVLRPDSSLRGFLFFDGSAQGRGSLRLECMLKGEAGAGMTLLSVEFDPEE